MSLPLVESLQHDAVSREHDIDAYIPPPEGGLTPYRRAVALALGKERDGQVETTWASAGADADPLPSDPDWAGHLVYLDERSYSSDVDPEARLDHHRRDRRPERLVFPAAGLARPRLAGQADRRGRAAARPAAPAPAGRGRSGGLVAGGADRPRPAAPAAGRNAGAGPGLAGALGGAGGNRQPLPPAGHLLPEGSQRPACTGWRSCRSTA